MPGAKSGGNQVPASQSLLSVKSTEHTIPPIMSSDNVCEMLSTRDTQQKLCTWVFVGADHVGTLCLTHTKILDSEGKADDQHKPHCLHEQYGHGEPSLSIKE